MSDAPDGPDARRALLAVVCALGLVAASTAAPALASQSALGGLDSPPTPSDVPEFLQRFGGLQELLGGGDAQRRTEAGSSALGALSAGDSTDVGGALSAEQQQASASPHFVAEAHGERYWRTEAYTSYTGSGWERESVNRVQPPRPAERRPTQWTRITLRQPASSLPTPWRPIDLDYSCGNAIPCDQDLSLSPTSGIEASPAMAANATYRVRSVDPVDAPSVLRDVRVRGSVVDTEYTTVETTDRVRERAASVVGDADNRYEAAKAVEAYLESEKTYSLTDVPEPGDHVADQFLFEQSAGYCEYFATTMTVMLRSQDVPARYVVGYAGGEYVGNNRYLVRGADAHAWVEVYFEDVGWVRFDPTPSESRSESRDALHSEDPNFEVSLNRTAVPGERVTATVTTAGLPAENVALVVNGDRVGQTDADGEVSFRVPYTEELRVRVETTVNVTAESEPTLAPEQPPVPRVGGGAAGSDDALAYSVPPPSFENAAGADGRHNAGIVARYEAEVVGQHRAGTAGEQADAVRLQNPAAGQRADGNNTTTQRFDVESDVEFTFDGVVEPGSEPTLEVRVAGKPFADAAVSVDGVEQGRTDENGRVPVRIPGNASGVVDVTASRGNLSETTTYPVDDVSVAVSPSLVAPLPGTAATARVTAGGEPVADAAVTVAGERVGATGDDGRVRFEIPLARAPAVTAAASGKQATTHVGWVLPTTAVTGLAVLGALAGVVAAARRRGVTLRGIADALTAVASEAVSLAVGALVGVADAVDELAAELRAAAEDGWRGVLAWLASLPGRLELPAVGDRAAAAVAAARTSTDGEPAAGSAADGTAADEHTDAGGLQSVWRRFVGVVGVERRETKTPGEVAREAVRRGFPEEPVYAVTNAFRDAAYGDREVSSRLQRARRALAALRGNDETAGEEGGDQ